MNQSQRWNFITTQMTLFYSSLLAAFIFTGCQMLPTKVSQTSQIENKLLTKKLSMPLDIDDKTIIIDARTAFEYASAHIPGAISINWEMFSQSQSEFPGLMTENKEALIRSLALKGLFPEAKIVVVGNGLQGKGEEGRVAWSLLYLGFQDVQVAQVDLFKMGMNNAEPAPRPNQKPWEPKVCVSCEASQNEVLKAITQRKNRDGKSVIHLIDVRDKKEYFSRSGFGQSYKSIETGAIHIPWTQFYNSEGRVRPEMREQLLALGWSLNDRLIVMSEKGVRSGAVSFALSKLGFRDVANFTKGVSSLAQKKITKTTRR